MVGRNYSQPYLIPESLAVEEGANPRASPTVNVEQERKLNSISLRDISQIFASPKGEESCVQILLRKVVFR